MHSSFGYIDALLMVLCLLFALGGFQKGFAAQLAQLLTFIVSAIGLFFIYPFVFTLAQNSFNHVGDTYIMWVLLAIHILLSLIFYIAATKALAMSHSGQLADRTDHALGMLAGMIRGIFMVLFLMIAILLLAPVQSYKIIHDKSALGTIVCDELIPQIQPHMTPANFKYKIQRARSNLRNNNAGGFYDR